MSCLDDNQISAVVAGRVPPDQRAAIEAHIDSCEACREMIAVVAGPTTLGGTSYLASGSRGSSAAPALRVGDVVGQFRIEGFVGGGGMGDVYRARDEGLDRSVALKLIHPDLANTPAATELFLVEARATAQVRHPNIVTVHALGEHAGQPYMVLELLDGWTLHEKMSSERLALERALSIGAAIAGALAEAHRRGVLHRDLKPANIHLGADGVPRVLDFGLATLVHHDNAASGSNPTPSGTPRYMAPEQWAGTASSRATDIWALGLVLFEMCAGQHPFDAASMQVQRALVCGDEPAPSLPTHIPESVRSLIRRCVARQPADRPSAQEVATTLEDAAQPAAKPLPPAEPRARRAQLLWPLAALTLAATVGVVVWVVATPPETTDPPTSETKTKKKRPASKKKKKQNKQKKSSPRPVAPIPSVDTVPCDPQYPTKKKADEIVSCRLAKATKFGMLTCAESSQIQLHGGGRLKSCRLSESVVFGDVACAAGYSVNLFGSGKLSSCQLRASTELNKIPCDKANVQLFTDGRLKRCRTTRTVTNNNITVPSGSYLRLHPSGKPDRVERPSGNTVSFKGYDCVTLSYFESSEIKTCAVNERPKLGDTVLPFINRTYCFERDGSPTQAHGLECFLNK